MSIFSRLWHKVHVHLAAEQRRRAADALTAAEEAERIAKAIAAAKLIGQAVLDGHAAAKADQAAAEAAQFRAKYLGLKPTEMCGMPDIFGLN